MFLALSINDLGSIFSVGEVLKLKDIPERVTRGFHLRGYLISGGALGHNRYG